MYPLHKKNNINYVTGLTIENAQVLFTIHEEIPLLQSNGNLYTFKEGYAQTVKQLGQNIPYSATLILANDKNIYLPILYEQGGMLTLNMPEANPEGSKLLLTSTNGKLFSINEYGENFEILQSDFGTSYPLLLQKRDGAYYVKAHNQQIIYEISADGTQKNLLSSTYSENVIEAADGNLYGIKINQNSTSEFFSLTPQGTYTTLSLIPLVYNNGRLRSATVMQALDGNFYGSISWALNNNVNPPTESAIFRIEARSYQFTQLLKFERTNEVYTNVEGVYGKVVEGNDGYLYTTSFQGGHVSNVGTGIITSGAIIRIKKDGTDFSTVFKFGSSHVAEAPNPENEIMITNDGYIYGASDLGGGQNGFGFIYRVKTDGTDFQYLKHFSQDEQLLWGGLKQLPSGRLVGALHYTPNSVGNGGSFTMNPDGSNFYYIKEFDAASEIIQPFSIIVIPKQSQTITFNPIGNKQIGDVFELVATSSSGLPVTFTSSNPNIVSINGITATVHAAGEVTITAKAAGNDVYLEAYDVSRELKTKTTKPPITLLGMADRNNSNTPSAVYTVDSNGENFRILAEFPRAYSWNSFMQARDGSVYVLQRGVGAPHDPALFDLYGKLYRFNPFEEITSPTLIKDFEEDGFRYDFNYGGLIENSKGDKFGLSSGYYNVSQKIFKISKEGLYSEVYDFQTFGEITNMGKLTIGSDGYIYGMTNTYFFKVKEDGSDFTILKSDIGSVDGFVSNGNGLLYGIASDAHGSNIFRMNEDGSNFTILYSGIETISSPMLSKDGFLYGISAVQTVNDSYSYLYKINPTNGEYSVECTINNVVLDIVNDLFQSEDGIFYGGTVTMFMNGELFPGGVFSIDTRNCEFEIIRKHHNDFDWGINFSPIIPLRQPQTITFNPIGNKQIGDEFELVATSSSGLPVTFTSSNPNILSINGTTATVHAAGEVTITAKAAGNDVYLEAYDVLRSLNTLEVSSTTFIGVTNGSNPVVFRINSNGTNYEEVIACPEMNTATGNKILQAKSGKFILSQPGSNFNSTTIDYGSIYQLNSDGSEIEKIVDLDEFDVDLTHLAGNLIELPNGTIVGTRTGSSNSGGSIFKISKGVYSTIYQFSNSQPNNGLDPSYLGSLKYGPEDYLFGVTVSGGVNNKGTIYRVKVDGEKFQILHHFDGANGEHPIAGLVLDNAGFLYGTTEFGGDNSNGGGGVIFKIKYDGSEFQIIHDFSGLYYGPWEGVFIGEDDKLYGYVIKGYQNYSEKILYSVDKSGTNFSEVHAFPEISGAVFTGLYNPIDGYIYGSTDTGKEGNDYNNGFLFRLKPDGTGYSILHQFSNTNGKLFSELIPLRQPQTITFNPISNKQIGDEFELVATSSSGLPVTLTSSNPNIVSINGTTATVHAAGEVTITAKAAGNDVYLEAYDLSNNIIVLPDFDFEIWGKTSSTTGADGGTFFKINNTGKHDTYTIPGILSSEIVQGLDGAAYAGVSYYTGQENSPDNFNGLYKLNLNGTYEKLIDKIDVFALLLHSNQSIYGIGRTLDDGEKVIVFRINGSNFVQLSEFDFSADVLFPSIIELPNNKLAVTIGKDLYTLNADGTEKQLIYETTIGSNISASFEYENFIYGIVTNFVGSPPSQVSGFVYKIGLDGSNFSVIRNFNNRYVQGKLTLSNESIYGVFQKVGVEPTSDSDGGIFKIMLKDNSYSDIHLFNDEIDGLYGAGWWGKLEEMPDDALYSTSYFGGSSPGDGGFIFRIKNDVFERVYDFKGSNLFPALHYVSLIRQPQTITFNPIGNKQIGDEFELVATSSSGLPVTLTSSNPNIVSINGTTATVHAAGEVTITAKVAGNDVYLEAYDITQVFSTSRLTQTITFNAIGNKQIGDVFDLVATSSSGLPVTFTSSNPNIVSINGATATVLAVGEVTLTAEQGGNDVYLQASDVTQNLLVIVLDVQPEENFYISEPYPNPNDGTCINFNIKQPSGVSLNIYLNTLLGSELGNTTLFANGEDEKVCIASNLKQGTYLVSIKSSTGFVIVYKVVVP